MWISITGDDVLTCEREEHIENDKNAVAVIWDDCVSKKAVGHIPLKWSKVAFRGGWKGSQSWCLIGVWNTCKLFFYGDARVIARVKNSLEILDNELRVKVKKCVK